MRPHTPAYETYLLPVGALLVFVPLAFLPVAMHPLAYNVSGAVTGLALCVYALRRGLVKDHSAALAAAGAVFLVALGVSAALAASPGVSLVGLLGQHSGWLLYAAMYLWLVAGMTLGSRVALRRLTAGGALFGAALAAMAIAERAGLFTWGAKYSREPSGVLDNPTSLSQTLVVTAACAVAWLLSTRTVRGRVGALASGALALVGLASAQVLGPALSAVAGAVAALALWKVPPRRPRQVTIATWTVVAVLLLTLAAAWVASAGIWGQAASQRLSALSNRRTDIWASTFVLVSRSPLMGRGPDQFGVWQEWLGKPSGELTTSGTLDAHDSLLALLAAGGLVGLAAALAVVWVLVRAVLASHARLRFPPAALALIGGAAGWAISTLLSWIYLPAAIASAALVGCVLCVARDASRAADPQGPAEGSRADRAAPWAAGAIAAVTGAALLWAAVVPFPIEVSYVWATRRGSSAGFPPQLARDHYSRWPDPEYAAQALDGQFSRLLAREPGAEPDSLALVDETRRAALHDSRTAFARIKVVQAVAATSGRDLFDEFVAAADTGRHADPASGFWDFVIVLEAMRTGRRDDAVEHARAASRFADAWPERPWLGDVIAGTAKLEPEGP